MSNECDFLAEVVWKSAGIVQWDVCMSCVFVWGLACIRWSLQSYRFKQIIKTHSRAPCLFWLHAETTKNTQLLCVRIKKHDSPLTFFQLYAISKSTDFSIGLISEKLNWHKLKMIQHWIKSLRLKRRVLQWYLFTDLCEMNMEISVQFLFAEQSALKPPPLIRLFSAVQELCGNKVFYSIRTRIRDNLIYLRIRGHFWGHQTLHTASVSHTHTHKISFMHWKPLS